MPRISLEEAHRHMTTYRRLTTWRTAVGDFPDAASRGFDDSSWEPIDLGYSWDRRQGDRWFRKTVIIPESILGVPVEGARVDVRIFSVTGFELHIDGCFADGARFWFDGIFNLSKDAKPGSTHTLAMRSPRAETGGGLSFAEWYFDIIERKLLEVATVAERSRLVRELARLGCLNSANDSVRTASAGLEVDEGTHRDLNALCKAAAEHGATILPGSARLSDYTIYLVGHAHIDMNWLWDWEDTVDVCRRTFRSVDRLMDEYPDFIFSHSQAATYHAMEELEPAIFRTMQKRVREGRWDVTASTWVEGDLNMASGESLVRQATCALNYIEAKFGVSPAICWCPDTFGHPWTYPQILRKCGLKYYYGHRCQRAEDEHLMWWESPDGSRILAFNEGATYNERIQPGLLRPLTKMVSNFGIQARQVVFGVGDHGGGPTRIDLGNAAFLNRQAGLPRFGHSRAEDFYRAVENCARIPVVRDELNFVFEGCYTTHGDIKWMNRRGECLLYQTEVLASLAKMLGAEYPSAQLRQAWRKVLFNQFHDLLDGSAIHAAYDYSRRLFDQVAEICREVSERSEPLALELNGESDAGHVTVFNPAGWARAETVRLPAPDGVKDPTVLDAGSDARVPSQIRDGELVFTAKVPPVGYALYRIVPAVRAVPDPEGPDSPRAIRSTRPGQPHILENRFFRISVSPDSGAISSLYDKRLNRELVSPAEPINLFQICYERPHGMSAWTIGPISRTENLSTGAETEIACQGPVQAAIVVRRSFGKSNLRQEILIHRDLPRIDFSTEIDWQEIGGPDVDSPMLKVAFPFAHSSATCIREIPFGHIQSPTNGREIPSQTFLELPGEGFGVALLNDCKYGHDVKGNTVRLTLLRAAYDPDPFPDIGNHRILFSLFPHQGGWRDSEAWKRGHEINLPLRLVPGRARLAERSWIEIDHLGVDLAALKCADDGEGIVIRLVEMHGRSVRFNLRLGWNPRDLHKCDLRERPVDGPACVVHEGRAELELEPFEIGTWRIS